MIMTTESTESSRLLHRQQQLSSPDDVEAMSRRSDDALLDFAPTTRSLTAKLCFGRSFAAMAFVVMMGCIALSHNSTMPTYSSKQPNEFSDPNQWNDALFHEWESFLNGHMGDATAGVGLVFKSQAKKEAHAQHKQAKKEYKMKSKEVKQGVHDNLDELLYLNNTRAVRLVRHDSYNAASDFFLYQQGWEAQINQAYCAIATSAAVLNSYRGKIELPQDPLYEPFPWATQMTLVTNQCVKTSVFDVDSVKRAGLGLGMVPNLLNCFLMPQGYVATSYPVDPDFGSQHEIKDIVVNALLDEDSRVVLNYDRGGIGQGPLGHGHWSPIGAYSAEIDAFLIMDVAKYKYPPVWVPADAMFGGVGTLDLCSAMKEHILPVDWNQDFATIGQELGCTPGYRGFVVILPLSDTF
jgi:Phytochelatin synthase